MDLDQYQDEIGGISRYQVVIIVVICWTSFGTTFISQASNFLNAVPEFRCSIPYLDSALNQCNLTEQQIKNLTIPTDKNEDFLSCYKFKYNVTNCGDFCENLFCVESQFGTVEQELCDNGYKYNDDIYGETTSTQFNIVCDREYEETIAQTLFFAGYFIGSFIVGPLCDWFGRKPAIVIMTAGFVGSCVACAFSSSYEVYMITRMLSAGFGMASYISVFTYVNEISNTKRRTETAVWINQSSAFAHTVLPGLAYYLRDWYQLQLTIALIPVPIFFFIFFLPETPRWLLANGKYKKAKKVVSRYAKSQGTRLSEESWKLILKTETEKMNLLKKQKRQAPKIRIWDLFRRPLMRILCFNVMFSWFTVSMVFYGLALNGGNLSGDPYVNNTLNAVVEIFANLCIYLAFIFGRRSVLTISFVMAGLFCLASMLFDLYSNEEQGLLAASTVFAIAGKFFASIAFAVIYSVTFEIFPTNARATGVSLGSMAAQVGTMLSPLILQQQNRIPWLTQTIFGVLSVMAGFLSLLYPETANTEFVSTMDEAEDYYRKNTIFASYIVNKPVFKENYEEEKKTLRKKRKL